MRQHTAMFVGKQVITANTGCLQAYVAIQGPLTLNFSQCIKIYT